jgi:hypothetical protein
MPVNIMSKRHINEVDMWNGGSDADADAMHDAYPFHQLPYELFV